MMRDHTMGTILQHPPGWAAQPIFAFPADTPIGAQRHPELCWMHLSIAWLFCTHNKDILKSSITSPGGFRGGVAPMSPLSPCLRSLLWGEVSICLRAVHQTESLSASQPTCRLPRCLTQRAVNIVVTGSLEMLLEPGSDGRHDTTLSWWLWLVAACSPCERHGFEEVWLNPCKEGLGSKGLWTPPVGVCLGWLGCFPWNPSAHSMDRTGGGHTLRWSIVPIGHLLLSPSPTPVGFSYSPTSTLTSAPHKAQVLWGHCSIFFAEVAPWPPFLLPIIHPQLKMLR